MASNSALQRDRVCWRSRRPAVCGFVSGGSASGLWNPNLGKARDQRESGHMVSRRGQQLLISRVGQARTGKSQGSYILVPWLGL